MEKKWHFPSNSGGELTGFNNGALDQFKGQRLSSTVRELIQNSLDAPKIDDKAPIGVKFRIYKVDSREVPEITFIKNHLVGCRETAERQKIAKAVKFYDHALKSIAERQIKVLAVHDYNSKGLTGNQDDDFGAWSALVKGTGLSQKPSGSLGSFGHGSKAPFSLSDIRTVFYLSHIQLQGRTELRFQGKSILQSHQLEGVVGRTQGTGYYGWSTDSNCSALIDDDVPEWAKRIREDVGDKTGTTILIPCFNLDESELPETAISCISNFYYAIMKNNLEVDIHGETILDVGNIKDKYFEYKDKLEVEKDYIDHIRIAANFESLSSVVEPDYSGIQEVNQLDTFSWYLKLLDEKEDKRTRVVIARKDGMLIKHNPIKLERFQMVKSFEMFVCVDGERGSDLLKSIENPQHNDFEFDRIDDLKEREDARSKYERIVKKVREIIKRHAAIEAEEESSDSTLNRWFKPSIIDSTPGEGIERGVAVRISRMSTLRKAKKANIFKPGDGNNVTQQGQGHRSGDGEKKSEGGSIAGPGSGLVTGRGVQSASKTNFKSLNNLRVVASTGSDRKLSLIFDNPGEGEHQIIVERVGEESRERVNIKVSEDMYSDQVSVQFGDSLRQKLSIESNQRLAGYALEARLVLADIGGSNE